MLEATFNSAAFQRQVNSTNITKKEESDIVQIS